jgi:hypothetical protein
MDALLALCERFGDRLTLERFGNEARWSFDGQGAVVEFGSDGLARATFEDRPSLDRASQQPCRALYRPQTAAYSVSLGGCESLARDVADFFSGVREPRFVFSSLR